MGGWVLSALVRRQAVPRGPRRGQGAGGPGKEAMQLGLQVVPHLAHLRGRGGVSRAGGGPRTALHARPRGSPPSGWAGGDMPPPAWGHCPRAALPTPCAVAHRAQTGGDRRWPLCPLRAGQKRHGSARHRSSGSTVVFPALPLTATPASPGPAGQTPGRPPPGAAGEGNAGGRGTPPRLPSSAVRGTRGPRGRQVSPGGRAARVTTGKRSVALGVCGSSRVLSAAHEWPPVATSNRGPGSQPPEPGATHAHLLSCLGSPAHP